MSAAGGPSDPRLPLLVFDGACPFCSAAVDWLAAHVRRPLRAVPYQWARLEELGLDARSAAASVWWIEPDGARLRASAASARCLQACAAPWRWLGRLLELPLVEPLAELGYALVSRLRMHLPGATPQIERGAPDARGRVLQPRAGSRAR